MMGDLASLFICKKSIGSFSYRSNPVPSLLLACVRETRQNHVIMKTQADSAQVISSLNDGGEIQVFYLPLYTELERERKKKR